MDKREEQENRNWDRNEMRDQRCQVLHLRRGPTPGVLQSLFNQWVFIFDERLGAKERSIGKQPLSWSTLCGNCLFLFPGVLVKNPQPRKLR